MPINCANSPLSGVWAPQNHLKHLYYGAGCVQEHLVSNLPSSSSRVLIITGTSIYTKTPLINNLEALLGHSHAATFSGIQQHGQEDGVDQAAKLAADIQEIDTILSIGGGSPIDSAKTVCYRIHEKAGRKLVHMAIPTTLSAAECTAGGGFTRPDGTKVGFMHPAMGVSVIFYDASFARYTPERLWLSTGMRAVDHAVETMYHPNASEMPWKALAIWALTILAENLPLVKDTHGSEAADDFTTKLQLAAFASSGLRGSNFSGGMGLSHSLGHALGSPYGIPHGETSCLTLGPVIRHQARTTSATAQQISRLFPAMGGRLEGGDALAQALEVAQRVEDLIERLGLTQPSLSERGVGQDQLDVIARRVCRGEPPDSIVGLVRGLF